MSENILLFLAIGIGLYMAWNIGANDVSNALGTAVGSKALTLKKALIIAAILEFSGAYLLGSHVSSTIQKGIIDPNFFAFDPMIFIFGMIGTLLATGIWLNLASYLHLPVSTTHAIIGAILGFGAIVGGVHAVNWPKVFFITTSWILSPILSGLISYILFTLLQKKILYSLHPLKATKRLIPFLSFIIIVIFISSLLLKGPFPITQPLSLLISISIGAIAFFITIFLLKKIPNRFSFKKSQNLPQQAISLEKSIKHLQRAKLSSYKNNYNEISSLLKQAKDLSKKVKKEAKFSKVSSQYLEVEKMFTYLQIMSICLVAFAHGANDVANAIGPVAAVTQVLKNHQITQQFFISPSILMLGGLGIVIGLATWGWRVIETIGKKITELTPTRGFSAELGAAITILLASKLGLPISTTQALVGSVLGVGLARGINAINLKTVKDIFLSWFVTIPTCAILSIIAFYILKFIFQ